MNFAISRPIVVIDCMMALPNRGCFGSTNCHGTHVPLKEEEREAIFRVVCCARHSSGFFVSRHLRS